MRLTLSSTRPGRVARSLAALTGVLTLVAALAGGSAGAVGPGTVSTYGDTAKPLFDLRGAADPSVVRYGDTWVAMSTGRSVPRATAPSAAGPWTDAGVALGALPSWATGDRIWASDLVHIRDLWVLYYAAPVGGLASDSRCIGAAIARSPLDPFTPLERPLVCPKRAMSPKAYDDVRPGIFGLPKKTGVIDPESWTDDRGRNFLLYRTQSQPSSIRMVQITRDGLGARGKRDSIELLRRGGVLENPVLVQRGKSYVLLTSRRSFVDCRYSTTYRKAKSLEELSHAKQHVLLDSAGTGLCGPGGADLAGGDEAGNDNLLFLHSWACRSLSYHCPAGINYDATPTNGSYRALLAATLSWSPGGKPRVTGFVTPAVDPWAPKPVVAPVPKAQPAPAPAAPTPVPPTTSPAPESPTTSGR